MLEFKTKKDRQHYFREVRNICMEGRVERTKWSLIPITFLEEDVRLQGFPHNDALVIEANIASWTLGKFLVDNGSSADIIFVDAYDKMGLSRDLLQPPPPRHTIVWFRWETHSCSRQSIASSIFWHCFECQNRVPIFRCSGDVLPLQWHPGKKFSSTSLRPSFIKPTCV
jgi:hypothetical protein